MKTKTTINNNSPIEVKYYLNYYYTTIQINSYLSVNKRDTYTRKLPYLSTVDVE